MAKFNCPILTCNVKESGDFWNIAPMMIMHMAGSHQINLTEDDIREIISWQADPQTQDKPWPKLYPEVKERQPVRKVKDKDALKKWWDSLNK